MVLYQAAASRGISARELNDCALHEVRWMFAPTEDPDEDRPESEAEYRARVAEAMAAKAEGRELTFQVAGMKTVR